MVWFVAGLLLQSRWVILGPVALAAFVLISGNAFQVMVTLGGDYEFWWTTYVIGAPFFMIGAELGYRLGRALSRRRSAGHETG